MASANKQQVKRKTVSVPKDLNEANDFIQSIGQAQRVIQKIQSELNEKVIKLQSDAVEKAKEHEEEIEGLLDGLYAFAESNRNELTEHGKRKTVTLPTGEFLWRTTPPKVTIRNVQAVLAELKKLELTKFIRTIEEPDKESMLKERALAESVKGISITQTEEFAVKPNELKVEVLKKKKVRE